MLFIAFFKPPSSLIHHQVPFADSRICRRAVQHASRRSPFSRLPVMLGLLLAGHYPYAQVRGYIRANERVPSSGAFPCAACEFELCYASAIASNYVWSLIMLDATTCEKPDRAMLRSCIDVKLEPNSDDLRAYAIPSWLSSLHQWQHDVWKCRTIMDKHR